MNATDVPARADGATVQQLAAPRQGRQAALERFLAEVERRAFRQAQLAVGNVDDALELVQEAMLRLVQAYAERPEAEWPLLFQRVLQNRIADHYRRSSVRRRVFAWWRGDRHDDDDDESSADAVAELADPHGRTPLETLLARSATDQLLEALATLPLRQRQAFLLRVWDGFDTAQAAYAMECSEGSVKTHLSRALQRLRGALEEYAP